MSEGLHDKIKAMQEADINLGSKVEITLREGAQWYDGSTPAPTVNPQGYCAPEEDEGKMTDDPGMLCIGYVGQFENNRVTIAPMWGQNPYRLRNANVGPVYVAGNYFVHGDTIHSFRRLRSD